VIPLVLFAGKRRAAAGGKEKKEMRHAKDGQDGGSMVANTELELGVRRQMRHGQEADAVQSHQHGECNYRLSWMWGVAEQYRMGF
jgi:hypothetical protein